MRFRKEMSIIFSAFRATLLFFVEMSRQKLPVICLTHEPGLGYAADAYARLNGFSVVFVTYGAGGLNMVNSIAQAYAENSPILVVSGAPEQEIQKSNLMVHHKVKSFDTQLNIFSEICCIARKIKSLEEASSIISKVIEEITTLSKPGYIEIPRNLMNKHIKISITALKPNKRHSEERLKKALVEIKTEIQEKFKKARNPVILAGSEIIRKGLQKSLEYMVSKYQIPCMTTIDGKSAIDETNPNFAGSFMGNINSSTQNLLNSADLLIVLGAIESDMNTGFLFEQTDRTRQIHAVNDTLFISYHSYPDIPLKEIIKLLSEIDATKKQAIPNNTINPPLLHSLEGNITTDKLIGYINFWSSTSNFRIIIDVGDFLFNSIDLRAADIMAPSYYASMGFAIPASISSCLIDPTKKPVVFVGDGAFQMTGSEIGVLKKYNLKPLILILNNGGYETMRTIDEDREIYEIPKWNYVDSAKSMGVNALKVENMEQFILEFESAITSDELLVIELIINKNEKSIVAKKIRNLIHKKMLSEKIKII